MALATLPTFTPSATVALVTPPPTQSDPAGIKFPYQGIANTIALPAGSSPATVLISNLGPEPAFISIAAAVVATTGTANAGSTAVTLASGTSVAVGQAVVGTGIAQGTFVSAISGTALTLSIATTAALASGALSFVAPVTPATGVAVQAGADLALAYVTSGFISAICTNGGSRAILNCAVGV